MNTGGGLPVDLLDFAEARRLSPQRGNTQLRVLNWASAGTARSGPEGTSSRDASSHDDLPGQSSSRNLADFLPQVVCVLARDGSAGYFNLYWETYTGLSEEDSLRFGWTRAFCPDDVHAFLKQLRNSAGGTFEAEVISSPGIMIRAAVPRRALVAHACD